MSNTKKENEKLNPMVITDPDDGREYTLEFNRKSVSKTEQAGLDINKLDTATMTMIPILFWGAFQWHHPHMPREQTDKILFDGLGGLNEEEMAYLGRLYAVPFSTLMNEGEGGNPRKMAVRF